jgi:Fe-S oxidoreductase
MTTAQYIFRSPSVQSHLGIPGPFLQLVLLLLAIGAFTFIMHRRLTPMRRSRPDPRSDSLARRIRNTIVVGFGQSRQPRYPLAGILHILIFFGFLILSIRSITLIGEAFSAGYVTQGLGGIGSTFYATLKDYTELIVLVCCVVAIVRRAVFRPLRYHDRTAKESHAHEAYIILGLISLLMIADAIYEGSEMAVLSGWSLALPAASLGATAMRGLPGDVIHLLHYAAFWIHNTALLFFLCYLPLSKHFHVITAIPNVFFSNLAPGGKIKPPRYEESDLDKIEKLGVGALEDFTWKHILDFYSCTDCGRCSDHCPAYATGTPLSPRMISVKSRDDAYETYPVLSSRRGVDGESADDSKPALVGETIDDSELWACTTCGACEEACPVMIEYVDKIIDMRRYLVEEGRVPASLQRPLADLEKRGNPYGKMPRKRGDWLKDENLGVSGIRLLKKGERAEVLYFADSCTAYDPRIQQIAGSFAVILNAAGVDCGTLGADEVDSGHEARRIGEEGLYETLRESNLEALGGREFTRIVTADPHAMNALLHDYELEQPVVHHTQLLAELVEAGKLKLGHASDGRSYTFHDPCYLGRHNGIYEDPRRVLRSIPGIQTVEMKRCRNRSFCCGGGSLYLFYEGESDSRMGEMRLEMAEEVGAEVVITACPFCLINLEDAIKTTGREGKMEVVDLAELIARQLAVAEESQQTKEPR